MLSFSIYFMLLTGSKIVQKTARKCEKNLKTQFSHFLGHSEEIFDHKLAFFQKRPSDLFLISGAFRSFNFSENFEYQIKFL